MQTITTTPSTMQEHINTSYSPRAWIVCFTAALFFFYEFIQMNMFNTVSADLMKDFSIGATQLGNLSSIYYYANLLFLPLAGYLLDRFSTRNMILITILLCAAGIGLFAVSHNMVIAGIARFMSGIGGAFCFLSSFRIASRWFPAHRMAMVTGLIVTMAMTGGMVAQTPLTFLVELLGWRHALLVDVGLGVLIALLVWLNVVDYPPNTKPQISSHNSLELGQILKSFRLAYLSWQNWLCGIYTCLMNLPIALLGAIWGSLYLVQVENFSRLSASYLTMMLFIGTIIGGPVVGWFSDFINRRLIPMVMGGTLSLIISLIIIYFHHLGFYTYLFLFFALGFSTSTQVISYPLVAENNSKTLTATSVSVVSFSVVSGYAIFQPLFGWLMDLHWDGKIVDNVRIYSALNYYHALLIIPISIVIAIIISQLVRETYCQRRE